MTRKTTSEPIPANAFTVEPAAAEQVEAARAAGGPRVFDFTQPLELMDDVAKQVYYRLRRVALVAPSGDYGADQGRGDASRLPDGKIFTEAEVVEILGPDYLNGAVIDK